jgi:hypothetical protein
MRKTRILSGMRSAGSTLETTEALSKTGPATRMFARSSITPRFFQTKTLDEVDQGCRSAGIGCVERTGWLLDHSPERVGPIHERLVHYENREKKGSQTFSKWKPDEH